MHLEKYTPSLLASPSAGLRSVMISEPSIIEILVNDKAIPPTEKSDKTILNAVLQVDGFAPPKGLNSTSLQTPVTIDDDMRGDALLEVRVVITTAAPLGQPLLPLGAEYHRKFWWKSSKNKSKGDPIFSFGMTVLQCMLLHVLGPDCLKPADPLASPPVADPQSKWTEVDLIDTKKWSSVWNWIADPNNNSLFSKSFNDCRVNLRQFVKQHYVPLDEFLDRLTSFDSAARPSLSEVSSCFQSQHQRHNNSSIAARITGLKLKVVDIARDGNCLFLAVIDQIGHMSEADRAKLQCAPSDYADMMSLRKAMTTKMLEPKSFDSMLALLEYDEDNPAIAPERKRSKEDQIAEFRDVEIPSLNEAGKFNNLLGDVGPEWLSVLLGAQLHVYNGERDDNSFDRVLGEDKPDSQWPVIRLLSLPSIPHYESLHTAV